jgi:ABC-type branched-subunit amino acid transport system permease subunit
MPRRLPHHEGFFLSGYATEYIQQIVLYALVVIVASLGLNVIYGYTGQFSLGTPPSTA